MAMSSALEPWPERSVPRKLELEFWVKSQLRGSPSAVV